MAEGEEAEINGNELTEEEDGDEEVDGVEEQEESEMGEQEDETEQQEGEMEPQEDEMEPQEDEMEPQEDEMEQQEDEMGQQEDESEPQEDQMEPLEGEEGESEDLNAPIDEPRESMVKSVPEVEKAPQSEALQGKIDDNTMKELLQVEKEAKEAANAIYELKIRIEELLKKEKMMEAEEKELEQKNLQLKDLLLLFDEKTLKIQEIIANTNILESMPVRQPQAKHEEDVLPRVILCGLGEDYVPKLIVCNQKVKSSGAKSHECFSGCPGPSPPPCIPSTTKEYLCDKSGRNEEVDIIRSKLENDISTKDRLLNELQMKLQCLQNEIHMVATENAQLNDKIRRIQQDQTKKNQQSCQHKEMRPDMLAVRLQEYGKYTRKLEREVSEMEEDLDRVYKEICDALKARDRMSKNHNMNSTCRKR